MNYEMAKTGDLLQRVGRQHDPALQLERMSAMNTLAASAALACAAHSAGTAPCEP
jgi:hypothetical protein